MKAAFTGGLQGTQTGAVTINDTSGNIAATTLTDITAQTNGTVTAAAAGITISGNATDLTAALVTTETNAVVANGKVTITNTEGEVAATVLSAIGNSTGGTVTATGALTITGTTEEITNALVTESKLVVASNESAAVTFDGDNPTGAQLALINPKVSGTITLADNAQTFGGTAEQMQAAFSGGLEGTQTGNVTISDTEGTIAATTLTDITCH